MENNPLDQGIINADSEHFTDFRPNADRAQLAITFIWITLGFRLLDAFFQYNLITKLQDFSFLNYSEEKMNSLESAENISRIVELLGLAVYIASGIIFIRWFRRAYHNLTNFSMTSHSNGWAAGGWFVPILSWFRPYQIMKELFENTTEYLKGRGANVEDNTSTAIGIWWALWIVSNLTDNIAARINPDTTAGFINIGWTNIAVSLAYIPLAFLITKIIRNYNSLETQLQ